MRYVTSCARWLRLRCRVEREKDTLNECGGVDAPFSECFADVPAEMHQVNAFFKCGTNFLPSQIGRDCMPGAVFVACSRRGDNSFWDPIILLIQGMSRVSPAFCIN